ncbi:MAG: helix-turn-helix domain-containing protein [Lachnospiraceae bacterium]
MVKHDVIQVQGINSQGYGIIPKMVMQDKRLTIQAKAIYGYFCSYAGSGKTAFPSRKKIIVDLRISKDSFYKHFGILRDYGYIHAQQEKDEHGVFCRNVYTLIESIPCPDLPCPVEP